jgi:SAM-dependent methyltransferase
METKIGSFEWIANYEEIRGYFSWTLDYHRACKSQSTLLKMLEIGCGTSGISEKLQRDFPCLDITTTDYDKECVRHLRRQFPLSPIRYETLDILSEQDTPEVKYGSFDIVLDKGTFDALLVEGSVAQVIENIYRFLKHEGCYLLFSIHPVDFMNNFFGSPDCGLEILRFEPMIISGKASHCTVTLLRKSASRPFQLLQFAAYEKAMMDTHYKDENPLLTPQMEMQMRLAFASLKDNAPGLTLQKAFAVIFDPELEYEYDLFLEDLEQFDPPLQYPGYITLQEALRFLEDMQ